MNKEFKKWWKEKGSTLLPIKPMDSAWDGYEAGYKAAQPKEIVNGVGAKERIERQLMDCAELMGNFPEVEIDTRCFIHLNIYNPACGFIKRIKRFLHL